MCFHTKFGGCNSKNKPAMPLRSLKWSRAWQRHFSSYTLQILWKVDFLWDLDLVKIWLWYLEKWPCHTLDHFKLLKGVAGAFFEQYPPNLAKLFVFCRFTIDITITFGYLWLYRIWKNWKSFPLHMFRASCSNPLYKLQ